MRVGRSRDCDVLLDDELVSRVHLEIRPVEGGWVLVDAGSSGGTWIGGVRTKRHRLREGDRIQIGSTCLLVLDLDDPAAPAERLAATPVPPPLPESARRPGASRAALVGSAIALVASLAFLATIGVLVVRYRTRLVPAATPAPAGPLASATPPPAAPRARPPSAFAESATRALLDPSPDGVPRRTELGAFTATSKGGRLGSELVTVEVPAGGLPEGTRVTVSRVDAAPAAMRETLPIEKWGKHTPISPVFEVETGGQPLARPATISVPVASAAGLESFVAHTWDPTTRAWDAIPARYDAGTGRVTADVPHFSLLVIGALVVGAIAGEQYLDYEYHRAAACVDTTAGHFTVCWRKGLPAGGGTRPYVTPGKSGPETVTLPETVAELADALETAHAAYAAAKLKVPASKTWVYMRPYHVFAEYNSPRLVGSPYILVDQGATPLLAQANAAHEYFHYVQDLYMSGSVSPWWREASAVAVETQLFPANTSWLTEYYSEGSGTKEFADTLGRLENDTKYGYRVSLFGVFLARTHGDLDFQRRALEQHVSQPILPAIAAALGGAPELPKAWLQFGRSLVGSDWGSYLHEHERRILRRQYDLESLRLDPAKGALAQERPETPYSVFLYEVKLLRNRLPENRTGSGPILVRLRSDGESRVLHVIAPGVGEKSAPAPVNTAALDLVDRPVNASLTGKDPAVEVRRMSIQRANEVTTDLLGWLVDAEPQPSGNPVEVRVTWLLPPENLRFDAGRKKLLWDAHPLAAKSARPAAPFDGYAVYRQLKADSAPELLGTTPDPEYPVTSPDDFCARYAVTARLKATEVRGSAESDRTAWLSLDLKDPKDFTLEGRLEPRSDGPAKTVAVTAREAALGIRGLEVEATVAGETKTLYRKERTAERQAPGAWQPEEPVLFTPPPQGTGFRVVARAWLLPRDHRCFDRARHLLEKVIAEEKGSAPAEGSESRTVVQDSSYFKGPRSALDVGIGKAVCIGTAPTNLGKRTELTFTEMPKADELTLDGTIALELRTKAEPGGPYLYAFYGKHGLVTSQTNVTVATGVKDGYLPEPLEKKWVPGPERKTTDSLDLLVGGILNFDKPGGRGGTNLTLLCQSGKPGPESATSLQVRWTYPVDSLFMPKGAAWPAPPLSAFVFNGRYRVQYELGDSKGVFLETVERDAGGRLRTFQPASSVTGNRADRGRSLPRLDGALEADGSFRYTHRLWGTEKPLQAKEHKVETGEGRVTVVDGRTFRVEMTLDGKPMVVTYTRLP